MNRKRRRPVGTGHLFRPKYKDRHGRRRASRFWSVAYTAGGRLIREKTGTTVQEEAEQFLRQRLVARDAGTLGPQLEVTTLGAMLDMIRADYVANGQPSLRSLASALGHLERFFGAGTAARSITTDRVTAFIASRVAEGARPATVNRSLAALRRMFNLALRAGRVQQAPAFSVLRENNARQGFFEVEALAAVLAHLPAWARPVVEVGARTGWRLRSELLTRQWRHVDLEARWLRLDPGETKNREGRMFPLTPDLVRILTEQRQRTQALERQAGAVIPWVFHVDGVRIGRGRMDKAWSQARLEAGQPARLMHDLRRTVVRNMERAGVPRSVAKRLVGHKTDVMYNRYAIVEEQMIREAGEKLAAFERAARL